MRYPHNINKPKAKNRGKVAKPYTKEECLVAMNKTLSVKAAARYLSCSYQHLKRYMKLYKDEETGKSLFELHKNQCGRGVKKFIGKVGSKSDFNIIDIVEGRLNAVNYNPEKIKYRMIEEGLLKEECYNCGYHERRVVDYKIPIILHFKDNIKTNYGNGNLEFLCYNCYFLHFADVLSENDIKVLETHADLEQVTVEKNFQLDEYQLERMRELGLADKKPKDPNDGSEFISRI